MSNLFTVASCIQLNTAASAFMPELQYACIEAAIAPYYIFDNTYHIALNAAAGAHVEEAVCCSVPICATAMLST